MGMTPKANGLASLSPGFARTLGHDILTNDHTNDNPDGVASINGRRSDVRRAPIFESTSPSRQDASEVDAHVAYRYTPQQTHGSPRTIWSSSRPLGGHPDC